MKIKLLAVVMFGLTVVQTSVAATYSPIDLMLDKNVCADAAATTHKSLKFDPLPNDSRRASARAAVSKLCKTKVKQNSLAIGGAMGDRSAILHGISLADKGEIADKDLVRTLNEIVRVGDPTELYFLGVFAACDYARELGNRISGAQLLNYEAHVEWIKIACDRGLDCSENGVIAVLNCAVSACVDGDLRSLSHTQDTDPSKTATLSTSIKGAVGQSNSELFALRK